jgi:protein MpaA
MIGALRLSAAIVALISAAVLGRPVRAAGGTLHRVVVIGYSVQHRPIKAILVGDPAAPRSMLVVGCIHGDERAGIPIARLLASGPPVSGVALWIVPVLNPDGAAADTRQNARGVDLNRNFPYRWRPLGTRGYDQYSGVRPLSAPEARAARRLILRIKPRITIWFHQPLGLVDLSGGNPVIERAYAHLVGLPVRRLTRYPGSGIGWENHVLPGTTAFDVELPPGSLSGREVTRFAAAAKQLARRFVALSATSGGQPSASVSPASTRNSG